MSRFSFKSTAFSLIVCAVIVAILNLYMNILASYGTSNMQIDLSADGDVIAFHQFEFPGGVNNGKPQNHHHHDLDFHDYSSNNNVNLNSNKHQSNNFSKMGLCPPANNLQTQEQYVNSLIRGHVKHLPPKTFAVDPVSAIGRFRVYSSEKFEFEKIWRQFEEQQFNRKLNDKLNLTLLSRLVSLAKITKWSNVNSGAQFKLALTLQGGRNVDWMPKRYSRFKFTADISSQVDEMDRHSSEIAAFYLQNLLNIRRTPFVVGRKINLNNELKLATNESKLLDFLSKKPDGTLCLQGSCFACPKGEAALMCPDIEGYMEGAIMFTVPANLNKFVNRVRYPWARTYDQSRLATWQTQLDFCQNVMNNEIFGKSPYFGDLIETAIFDYLVGNTHRRYVDYYDSNPNLNMVLLNGNGKAFSNPGVDETNILAPLYQCCRIREAFFRVLLNYSNLNLGDSLNEILKYDPVYPVLADENLVALNRRLIKVLALVSKCIDEHGSKEVFSVDTR